MKSVFDIFRKLPDGKPLWIGSVEGFDEAQRHLSRVAQNHPGEYFIYSELSGGVIERLSVPGTEERCAAA